MNAMIHGLLEYSRLNTRTKQLEEIDTRQIVDEVIDNLALTIGECQAEIQVGDLPVIMGERSQIMRLFQNLISNALKYHDNTCPITIEINAEKIHDDTLN